MTTILVADIEPTDNRRAGFWTSADGQVSISTYGATLAQARDELLGQCSTNDEREAILAGSIEVL